MATKTVTETTTVVQVAGIVETKTVTQVPHLSDYENFRSFECQSYVCVTTTPYPRQGQSLPTWAESVDYSRSTPAGIYVQGHPKIQYAFAGNGKKLFDEQRGELEATLAERDALVYKRILSTGIVGACSILLNIILLGYIYYRRRKVESSRATARRQNQAKRTNGVQGDLENGNAVADSGEIVDGDEVVDDEDQISVIDSSSPPIPSYAESRKKQRSSQHSRMKTGTELPAVLPKEARDAGSGFVRKTGDPRDQQKFLLFPELIERAAPSSPRKYVPNPAVEEVELKAIRSEISRDPQDLG